MDSAPYAGWPQKVLQSAVVALLAGCHDCGTVGPPPPPPPDAVASVEIYPAVVAAAPGATFTMRARLRNSQNSVLPDVEAAGLIWESLGSDVQLPVVPDGPSVVVTISAYAPPDGYDHTLTATIGGVTGEATVRIVPSAALADPAADWLDATPPGTMPGDPPVIALVTGELGGAWKDRAFGFSGRGVPGSLTCPASDPSCGSVVLFSTNAAVARVTPVDWRTMCDYVRFGAGFTPPAACIPPISAPALNMPIAVKLTVWRAAATTTLDLIKRDLDYARATLVTARAGLAFALPASPNEITDITSLGSPGVWITGATQANGWVCPRGADPMSVRRQLEDAGVSPTAFATDATTVVYVDNLYFDGAGVSGYTCPWNEIDGSIVLVSSTSRLATLAHEFGHAFGSWDAGSVGHVTNADGFDDSNLMQRTQTDYSAAWRTTLTLGQVFRMTLAAGSVLHRANNPAQGADCSSPASKCPSLTADAR